MATKKTITGADLPTELVELIFSYAIHLDTSTCAAVCRTNIMGCELAFPVLYRSVGIATEMGGVQDRGRRLQLLCRTLVGRPHLADRVREVVQYLDPHMVEQQPLIAMSEDDWDEQWCIALDDAVFGSEDLKFRLESLLARDAGQVANESCLLILLLCCTGIRSLSLTGDLGIVKEFKLFKLIIPIFRLAIYSDARESNSDSIPCGLHTMERLILRPTHSARSMDIEILLHLYHLETVDVHSLGPYRANKDFVVYPDTAFTMNDHLNMTDFSGGWFDLEWFLVGWELLTTVNIEWAADQPAQRRNDWAEIGAFLRERTMLERIKLSGGQDSESTVGVDCHGLGPLRCLNRLRFLHLPKAALLGAHSSWSAVDLHEVELQRWLGINDERFLPPVNEGVIGKVEQLLPDSLEELVVVCEAPLLTADHHAFLDNSGLDRVKDITLQNCTKTETISAHHGELQQ